ncbi:MAG TPA: DUF4396 domain-containing protein [Actinomycetota bacterium]|jgi:hypothetical protein|nr:DUF4396 domain-containing protein [Actinomycetota bacterium]
MEIYHHPPAWLEALSWGSLAVAFATAAVILADIYGRGHRQKMPIMEAVYPISALYWGPVALWFYLRFGRRKSKKIMAERASSPGPGAMAMEERPEQGERSSEDQEDRVRWWQVAKADSHCGAGCTLGDIGAEWLVFTLGLLIAGKALYADFPLDLAFAWTLGVVFQYFTIVPMRDLGPLRGIWAAIRADTLSIVAFQIGLFAGMFVYQELIFPNPLPKTSATYWMFMQLSMILGFFTALPANRWLLRKGWKEKM